MKTLLPILLLSIATAIAQSDSPPILAPNLQDGFMQNSDGKDSVSNDGSLSGVFVVHQGDGSLQIVKDEQKNKNVLKFAPNTAESHDLLLLPCLAFENMPQEFPQGITLQARIKPDLDWMLPSVDIFSARVSDRGPGIAVMFRPEAKLVDVLSGPGGFDAEAWGIISKRESAIPPYEWAHITATYDPEAKQFRLYINGELAAQSATGLELTPLDKTLTIGAYRSGYAYPFAGQMMDIAIFDYVRTVEQIRSDAAAGSN